MTMNVAMLTPLFPPDTSDSAQYAKLLAATLSDLPLTVFAYGKLPEAVGVVPIVSIDKSGFKLLTILRCLRALRHSRPTTLLLHNGPSTDLPALIYKLAHPALQLVYIESDTKAIARVARPLQEFINRQIKRRAIVVITLPDDATAYIAAEILPFATIPPETKTAHSDWWQVHLTQLKSYVR